MRHPHQRPPLLGLQQRTIKLYQINAALVKRRENSLRQTEHASTQDEIEDILETPTRQPLVATDRAKGRWTKTVTLG